MAIGAAANMVILQRNPFFLTSGSIRWRKTRTTTPPLPPRLVNFNLSNLNLKVVKPQIRSAAALVTTLAVPEPEPKADHEEEYGTSKKRGGGGVWWTYIFFNIKGKGKSLMKTAAVLLILLIYSRNLKGRRALAAAPPMKSESELELEVGRVHATSRSPFENFVYLDVDSVPRTRFRESQLRTLSKALKFVWYKCCVYPITINSVAFVFLFLIEPWVTWIHRSWLITAATHVAQFMIVITPTLLCCCVHYDPSTIFKLQLQFNLSSSSGRDLQADLNQIANTADTCSYEGLYTILRETVLAITRNHDSFISATSYEVAHGFRFTGAMRRLNQFSLQEMAKFYQKPFVNVNKIITKGSTSHEPASQIQLMEVTMLVAVDGKHELPTVNSSDDLKKVVAKLTSMDPEDTLYVFGVEVLWNPRLSSSWTRYLKFFK